MRANQQINTRNLFLCGVAALPLIVVEGSVRSFAEPKLAVLLLLASICLLDLFRRLAHSAELTISPLQIGILFLLLAELPAMYGVANLGLMLTSLTLQLSLLVISLWVLNTELSLVWLARAVMCSIAVVAIGALAMSLLRVPLFSHYAPFGSTVGLKNSVPVFLAQAVPFLLIALIRVPEKRRRERWIESAIAVTLLVISLWIVFAYRTRSAWWMILFYLAALGAYSLRTRCSEWRYLCRVTFGAAIAAVALCYCVPGQLKWRSDTPYLDSLMTLASLEHSSGRDKLWRVAIEIFREHPWAGIGLGNYPALWPEYLPSTPVDPKVFAFLRADLPLFNDYLQSGVECGVGAMVLFALTILILPMVRLSKQLCECHATCGAAELLTLCCVATALDAFVDAPFARPECVMLFAIAGGGSGAGWRYLSPKTFYLRQSLIAMLLIIGLVSARVTGATLLRRQFVETHNPSYLLISWQLWPWSSEWNSSHAPALQQVLNADSFLRLAEARRAAWPNDPESYLLLAKSREAQRRYEDIFLLFGRGIVTVPGGRCYRRGIVSYDQFLRANELATDTRKLSDEVLSVCP